MDLTFETYYFPVRTDPIGDNFEVFGIAETGTFGNIGSVEIGAAKKHAKDILKRYYDFQDIVFEIRETLDHDYGRAKKFGWYYSPSTVEQTEEKLTKSKLSKNKDFLTWGRYRV